MISTQVTGLPALVIYLTHISGPRRFYYTSYLKEDDLRRVMLRGIRARVDGKLNRYFRTVGLIRGRAPSIIAC